MTASCDTCRDPGHCCREFMLTGRHPVDDWRASAERMAHDFGVPFMRPKRRWGWHPDLDATPDQTAVTFTCDRLGPDGRCTQYEDRPQLCRDYQVAQDGLCAEWEPTFKGIPIRLAPSSPA